MSGYDAMKLRKAEGRDPRGEIAFVTIEGRNPATGSKIRSNTACYVETDSRRATRAMRSALIRHAARCVLEAAAQEAVWGHLYGSEVYESGGHEFFGGEPPVLPRFASEDLPAGIHQEE